MNLNTVFSVPLTGDHMIVECLYFSFNKSRATIQRRFMHMFLSNVHYQRTRVS